MKRPRATEAKSRAFELITDWHVLLTHIKGGGTNRPVTVPTPGTPPTAVPQYKECIRHAAEILEHAPVYKALPHASWDATLNTARYMFFHCRCGIYVRIRDGAVAAFVPFANKKYENNWHSLLTFDGQPPEDYRCADDRARDFACTKAQKRDPETILPVRNWWLNGGGIVCNVMPQDVWGEFHLRELNDMLQTTCSFRGGSGSGIPDCEFFINKRDMPCLRRQLGKDVYARFTGRPCLARESYGVYAPILSFYTGTDVADLPLPTANDWKLATDGTRASGIGKPGPLPTARRATAIFRGTATGQGFTAATNPRMRLVQYSLDHPDLLDAQFTSLNEGRDKVCCAQDRPEWARGGIHVGTATLHDPRPSFAVGKRVPLDEQCAQHQYIVYADGHCAASRYGELMASGRTILRVLTEIGGDGGHAWMFPSLKGLQLVAGSVTAAVLTEDELMHWPYDHFIIDSDLSNLEGTIQWLRANPGLDAATAANAAKLAPSVENIVEYVSGVLHAIAAAACNDHSSEGHRLRWFVADDKRYASLGMVFDDDDDSIAWRSL